MSRYDCDRVASACPSLRFAVHPSRLRWQAAHTVLLALLAGSALAQQHHHPHGEQDLLLLPPRVITSVQQDSPLTIITNPGDARQPIPASDGADYLKTIPGFSAVRGGGSNSDPVLRGMFGSRLKLLTNGGEMLGACPSRMDTPSSYIAPQNFDQLTVIKGPQTVAWGPGSSAGTVLFDRLPESFDEPGTRLDASVVAGSNTRRDLQLDGAIGSREGYLRLSGNRSRSGDYKDGNGDRVPSRWYKWNTDLALGWTPDDDTLLELSVGAGDGEARYAGRGMDGSQFERESLGLRFEKQFQGGALQELEARVYYNYADHVMDNYSLRVPPSTGMMAGGMASNVDRRTLGARLAATWVWEDIELLAGADAQRNTHRTRNSMGVEDAYRHQPWLKDASFSQIGLFSELTWTRREDQRLIGGVRLDQHHVEDFRQTVSAGHGGGHMPPPANPTAGETRRETLPAAFLRLEQDLSSLPATAYIGIGHVQRFPDYWELFSPRRSPGAVNAFDAIEPERTTQLDVGLQYQRDSLQAWISGYAGVVDDFILFDYTGMSSSAQNIDAHIMGAEAGLALDLTDNWELETSLAWAWGRNRSDGEAIPQMPPLDARFNLTYARDNWSAGALWRVVAAQSRTADGKGNVTSRDFGDSAGFGVLSLNAAYRFNQAVTASVGVDNLLDKAYAEHLNLAGNGSFGFPADTRINEPGRTLWAKLDLSF
ncbi:iron complex outermembrane recepter protein [Halopseudomonas formosensis]|uniref:Iron complex outermembrane recepter protein n=1 Tax=Halopseudomonas formosensis TaxID=1002526 RepID=A0A1I6C1H6_9GAMM|nr:TonB-dependent copper receptor [Halopseudomonas formosensis]SFQ87046.1 iron complex outermembrane recepter protein [Halopseudomonas formosensis]